MLILLFTCGLIGLVPRQFINMIILLLCVNFSPMRCSHVLLESVLLVEFLSAFNTYLSRRFSFFHCLLCLIIKFSVLFQHIFRRRFKSALVTFYAFSHISYRYCDCFIFMDTVIVSLKQGGRPSFVVTMITCQVLVSQCSPLF